MTPTWYEILGLTPAATPEQIKAAWRDATDKFEPGTGGSQFRMFNEAADVLLDADKRRAYDAEIGAVAAEPAPEAVVETQVPAPAPPAHEQIPAEQVPAPAQIPAPEQIPVGAASPPPARRGGPVLVALTSWLSLAILGVLATFSVVLAVVLGLHLDDRRDSAAANPNSYSPAVGTAASSVAERAVAAILSYDYRTMQDSKTAADQFLTDKYKQVYDKNFEGLLNGAAGFPGVTKTKTVVAADVLSTAVVDGTPSNVRVLVFVNQSTSRDGKPAKIINNRVVVTMVRQHGQWLVDKLDPLIATF